MLGSIRLVTSLSFLFNPQFHYSKLPFLSSLLIFSLSLVTLVAQLSSGDFLISSNDNFLICSLTLNVLFICSPFDRFLSSFNKNQSLLSYFYDIRCILDSKSCFKIPNYNKTKARTCSMQRFTKHISLEILKSKKGNSYSVSLVHTREYSSTYCQKLNARRLCSTLQRNFIEAM